MTDKIFLNDKLVNIEDGQISVGDSGFLYGAGLFETMRAYNGIAFRLDDHLDRLLTSAKTLFIEHSYNREYLTEAVNKVLEANNLTDAKIRLTLSAGAFSQAQTKPNPTLLITATKLQPYLAEYYKKGVLVVLCPTRQNITDPACGHKTTSYLPRMLSLKQAHEKKAAEALWFTIDGRLAEGCISNVFLVKDSKLFTPTTNTPVLPGIARKTVCELANASKIELIEKDLTIDDLLGADEVFITNVIMQVMPVVGIEKHTVGKGKPGAITKKIQEHYDEFMKNNCGNKK
ncbi:MAG: aminotransferase class IV [Sedimentisphaerales bacterium]|jgi:branched-chain amino acid aminotransferase